MAQKPNLWTDALCALYERERGGLTEAEREEIRAGEQITLEGVPPVTIRRWSRRPKGFATPTGDMTYDPSGTILLSQTGVNTDVIYAGESFITQARCTLLLNRPAQLQLRAKGGLAQLFLGQRPLESPRAWSLKTDLPREAAEGVRGAMASLEQGCGRLLTLRLTPLEEEAGRYRHSLAAETTLLPDPLTNFCSVAEFYPVDGEGRRQSTLEAAVLLLDQMAACCRTVSRQLEALP